MSCVYNCCHGNEGHLTIKLLKSEIFLNNLSLTNQTCVNMDQGQSTAGIANLITEANGFNAGGVKLGVIFFDRYMYIYPSVGKLLSLLSFIITTML